VTLNAGGFPNGMNQAQRILKNILTLTTAQFVGSALSLLVVVLIARSLGAEKFGHYSMIMAIAAVFQLIADGGVNNIMIREMARKKNEISVWLGTTKSLIWILSVAAFGLMVIAFQFVTSDPQVRMAGYLMGAAVLATFHAVVYNSVFRAFEEMEYNALTFVSHKVLLLTLIALFLFFRFGLIGVVSAYLVSNVCLWMFSYYLVSVKYVRPRLRIDLSAWKSLLKDAIPLGVAAIVRRIGWQVDILILTSIGTASAVGYFSAAYKIIQAVNLIPSIVVIPLFPAFARLAMESAEKLGKIYEQSVKFLVILGLPVVIILMMLSDRIVKLCFGTAFSPSAGALTLLAWTVLFLFPTAIFASLFTALGQQRLFTLSCLAALTINVALDFALIPGMSFLGACIGTLAAEVTLFAIGNYFLVRLGYRLRPIGLLWKPVLAGGAMALVLVPVQQAALWVVAGGAVLSGAVYLALLLVLKAFSPQEKELGRQMLRGEWRKRGKSPPAEAGEGIG
jgi:O-antigen/teichoic acid export membrane protein